MSNNKKTLRGTSTKQGAVSSSINQKHPVRSVSSPTARSDSSIALRSEIEDKLGDVYNSTPQDDQGITYMDLFWEPAADAILALFQKELETIIGEDENISTLMTMHYHGVNADISRADIRNKFRAEQRTATLRLGRATESK